MSDMRQVIRLLSMEWEIAHVAPVRAAVDAGTLRGVRTPRLTGWRCELP